ncbi:hypothetical protein K443DRAFT_632473, partial [Laccaria amethystina LaAM-08-1]
RQKRIDFRLSLGGDRGKRISNYITRSRIYTVNYEIKGDNAKIPRETIKVKNVPRIRRSGALRMPAQLPDIPTKQAIAEKLDVGADRQRLIYSG